MGTRGKGTGWQWVQWRVAVCLLGSMGFAQPEPEKRPAEKRGEPVGTIGEGVYTKPVWRRFGRGTYLGGYAEIGFQDEQDKSSAFRQPRLIPFIYSEVAPRIRFATEIEFEFGGPQNNQSDGEVKLEFATVDYAFHEAFGFRGGILLSPLGKLNLVHDSPLQDLTERPIVDRFVIPSTLSEAGMGFFGTLYPSQLTKLDYELYLVNGFSGGSKGAKLTEEDGTRKARGSAKSDNNNNKALLGRVAFSPRLGTEIGVSLHTGAYDDAQNNGLTAVAVDWGFSRWGLEFLGEWARVNVEQDAGVLARNKAVVASSATTPSGLQGYYLQLNYHFLQDVFRKGSTFTGVVRWDEANTNTDRPANSQQRLTLGVNFRPVEDAVFKLDYGFNLENFRRDIKRNDLFNFSVATYF